jgi:putative colanic acid biosysnthesis UDP-glucose lipid carrier transferase
VLNWVWVAGLMLAMGFATGYIREFSQDMLLHWLLAAPAAEFGLHLMLRAAAPLVLKLQGPDQRAIIVGMNEQGVALASRIRATPYSRIDLVGFVDSREVNRLGQLGENRLLGKLENLASIAKEQRVQLIYLSLPMASQPRILQLLDDLKDTTASIYFVPDMFFTDLIQGHTGSVVGMPVISVCETPFRGVDGLVKRASDIVLSTLILLLIAPLLLVVAIAVKLTSPGPIIFKQRRYGLDGEEIVVYKFRSMTVTEDGPTIKQAEKGDARVTPLGAFMRRTSIDELPQFVNVLQGRMSIVGPRPHAIAHNELYRKLIKGYMVRHKVRPGITGWAQVNGYRGETVTLDKMQGRIDYDLDYLRNWSLRLDLHIILKTIRLVLKDEKAH